MKSFDEYLDQIKKYADLVDRESIESAVGILSGCARVYIMGNGGSAAVADHWVCDYMKGINEDTKIYPPVKAISLVSNGPLLTALANDMGYENIFSKQLEYYRCGSGDVVLAISASGNSKNVVNGIRKARYLGALTIALTGFDGGEAAIAADINIHVPSDNYGVVEDIHMMVLHSISQRIRYRDSRDRGSLKL
jgi:D-sedoheptulose 7-phosphate isomerase